MPARSSRARSISRSSAAPATRRDVAPSGRALRWRPPLTARRPASAEHADQRAAQQQRIERHVCDIADRREIAARDRTRCNVRPMARAAPATAARDRRGCRRTRRRAAVAPGCRAAGAGAHESDLRSRVSRLELRRRPDNSRARRSIAPACGTKAASAPSRARRAMLRVAARLRPVVLSLTGQPAAVRTAWRASR